MKRLIVSLGALLLLATSSPAHASQTVHRAVYSHTSTTRIAWSNTDTTTVAGFNLYDGKKELNTHLILVRADGNYGFVLHHLVKHGLRLHAVYVDGHQTVLKIQILPQQAH